MTVSVIELARICEVQVLNGNPNAIISSAADIKSATSQQVTVFNNPKFAEYLENCQAAACFMSEQHVGFPVREGMIRLVGKNPEISFITAVNLLHPPIRKPTTISPHAVISSTVKLNKSIYIGPYVLIDDDCHIEENCEIHSGVKIGKNVSIGKNCKIYPNSVIYDNTKIGKNVIVHAGSVLGADGFGYKQKDQQHIKVPHIGNLVIEDEVEIGANTCIDRATFGSTIIKSGTKIDNLVQIGHNNMIGENVIICGQTGISGSCTIENNAILAGSAGIADHVKIGHHAVVMARSGVAGDIEAATQVFGSPAKDKKVAWRELAALTKLPELLKQIKNIEARLKKLEE